MVSRANIYNSDYHVLTNSSAMLPSTDKGLRLTFVLLSKPGLSKDSRCNA